MYANMGLLGFDLCMPILDCWDSSDMKLASAEHAGQSLPYSGRHRRSDGSLLNS